MRRGGLTLTAIASLGLIVALTAGPASAQPTGTLNLLSLNRDDVFTAIDNPPRGGLRQPPSAGDIGILRTKVRDPARQRVGQLIVEFRFTRGGRSAVADGVFKLRDGQITIQGFIRFGRRDAVAITGGTAAYHGASGTMIVESFRRLTKFRFNFSG